MRYKLVQAQGDLRRAFKPDVVYDERHVREELRKLGFQPLRPNGSDRTRGSRRLEVRKGRRVIARFDAYMPEDRGPVRPVTVGFL